MKWTQMYWFSWCKTWAATWRGQILQERACGLQAAVSAPGILNPGRVRPRHCLRVSWWHLEPTQQTSVPVSWAHQKVAYSWPALSSKYCCCGACEATKRTIFCGFWFLHCIQQYGSHVYFVAGDGHPSLWWILACSFHHTKLLVWVF